MGRGKSYRKFTIKMQKKLVVLFIAVLLAFAGLFYQLYRISRDNGEQYKKQVLSQQRYDSTTIPYKKEERSWMPMEVCWLPVKRFIM
ncbi:MAG: hypothetical protein V8S42_02870 [Lachnospiraceae bacterium]